MKVKPTQTGMTGVPGRTEPAVVPGVLRHVDQPFVLSTEIAGSHVDRAPDLSGTADALRLIGDDYRERVRSEGWFEWGGASLVVGTLTQGLRDWAYRDGAVDEERWRACLAGVPDEYDTVNFGNDLYGRTAYASPDHRYVYDDVRSVWSWLRAPLQAVEDIAARFVDELRASAAVEGVSTGFVAVDTVADPYTRVLTDPSKLGPERFGERVHGYYWAVLLTEGHLRKLGGRERVVREAPCARVEAVEAWTGAGLLCVLTDSPLDADEPAYRAWRAFLEPALRPAYPSSWEAVPGRAAYPASPDLLAPVWLFEGEPLPYDARAILEYGDSATGAIALDVLEPDVSGPRSCRLSVPPGTRDVELLTAGLEAVVHAWWLTGRHGRLHGCGGAVLVECSDVTIERGWERGAQLGWRFDPGRCAVRPALERLAVLARELLRLVEGAQSGSAPVQLVAEPGGER